MGRSSAPARGRGSKPRDPRRQTLERRSAPARGRGSKLTDRSRRFIRCASAPARGRGSKRHTGRITSPRERSAPARGRGSKQLYAPSLGDLHLVGPRAGPWIETSWMSACTSHSSLSAPARGRGSKPAAGRCAGLLLAGRPPRGAVDRNSFGLVESHARDVGPRAGPWIETARDGPDERCRACRPPRGAVDRNALSASRSVSMLRSAPARGRGSKRRFLGG